MIKTVVSAWLKCVLSNVGFSLDVMCRGQSQVLAWLVSLCDEFAITDERCGSECFVTVRRRRRRRFVAPRPGETVALGNDDHTR
jgi:hypothetical protein